MTTTLNAQVNYDSLRKYSYLVAGFKPVGIGQLSPGIGTGYFIRKDNKLFFTTAAHVFCPCDYKDTCKPSVKRTVYPDQMKIYLTNDGVFNYRHIELNIKAYRDTCKCQWPPIHPDLISYQVDTPTDTIYSIEKFLEDDLPKKRGAISVYGYPESDCVVGGAFMGEQNSSHLFVGNYSFYDNYKYKNCQGTYSIDEQDYIVATKELNLSKLFGYSGSPVFIFNRQKNNWAFIGTFTATVEDGKMQIIKPKFILEAIKNSIH